MCLKNMIQYTILLITLVSSVASVVEYPAKYSAASESQIRFARENNYDDTGPGSKGPEYAYNTYKSLQEALVSYVEDTDTKLPEHERMKFENYISTGHYREPIRELPKPVGEYTGFAKPKPIERPIVLNRYQLPEKQILYHDPKSHVGILDLRGVTNLRFPTLQENKHQYIQHEVPVKTPENIAPYIEDAEDDHYHAHPQYSFSYGVHDKMTGDSKTAHESRNGGTVTGYYSFMDPDGKQRTVRYTADDKLGFRATVQRTQMNAQ